MFEQSRSKYLQGLQQNSAYAKMIIEPYICMNLGYQWLDSNIKGIDGVKGNSNLEIKAVDYKPSICQVIEGKTLIELLNDEIKADTIALYLGKRNELLDSKQIKVLSKQQFIDYLKDRVVIDKDSQKNGGKMKLRFTNNYRTNSMTEKMKSMGLL